MRQFNIVAGYGPGQSGGYWDYDTGTVKPMPPRTRQQAIDAALDLARSQGALADLMVFEDGDGQVQGHCPWPEASE